MTASLHACGFHLRGMSGTAILPAELSTVRVVATSDGENGPLIVAVRQALTQAGATIVSAGSVPTITLLGENVDSEVVSISTTTAKASEYRLRYTVSFRVDGPQSRPSQSLRLQREFSVDPARVLAKEQEERELLRSMRQEAAQQLVRRLARAVPAR